MNSDINILFEETNKFISNGKIKQALKNLSKIEKYINRSPIIAFNYGGFSIDIGNISFDIPLIQKGIRIIEEVKKQIDKSDKIYADCCYDIADGISTIFQLRQQNSKEYYVGNSQIEYAKSNYREALDIRNNDPRFWINYGNLLNGRLGRSLEALQMYENAIKIDPENSMALANKGYVQGLFAHSIKREAGFVLMHEACYNLNRALEIGLDADPKVYFSKIIENYKSYFDKAINFDKEIECYDNIKKTRGKFKHFYRKFCHQEMLFLNPLGNNHRCEAALYDPLILNKFLVNIKEDDDRYYRFSGYLNQLKQEYATARYLSVQSFYKDKSIKFVDDDVILINTLDYPAFTIHLELAKSAFRIAFSILDKIAFVINEYFKLGADPTRLYFRNLSSLKDNKIIKSLMPVKNPFLSALIDLANDFENGHYKQIKEIRRAFEHRFMSIHLDFAIPRYSRKEILIDIDIENKDVLLLRVSEFRDRLLETLRISKFAIYYLVLMIEWNEQLKLSKIKNEKIGQMQATELSNELKFE